MSWSTACLPRPHTSTTSPNDFRPRGGSVAADEGRGAGSTEKVQGQCLVSAEDAKMLGYGGERLYQRAKDWAQANGVPLISFKAGSGRRT